MSQIKDLSNPLRLRILRTLITSFKRPIRCIEVGSWFGIGSTKVFLDSLPEGSVLKLIDCWDIESLDSSPKQEPKKGAIEFGLKTEDIHNSMRELANDGYRSVCTQVENFNIAYPGKLDISVIRDFSHMALPKLRPNSFDLIYLDSNHDYSTVKGEIQYAKELIREDCPAVLCGDDLEWPINNVTTSLSRQLKNYDYALPQRFHPGVHQAVYETLGTVTMLHGFWWKWFNAR